MYNTLCHYVNVPKLNQQPVQAYQQESQEPETYKLIILNHQALVCVCLFLYMIKNIRLRNYKKKSNYTISFLNIQGGYQSQISPVDFAYICMGI